MKKTRGGPLRHVVQEKYLREDLHCGIVTCTTCDPHNKPAPGRPHLDIVRRSLLTTTASAATAASAASAAAATYPLSTVYVLDTNVILHQMDVLCSTHNLFEHLNLVTLRTVDNEVAANSRTTHDRLRTLLTTHPHAVMFENEYHAGAAIVDQPGETPNDRNDRAIRTATEWYMNHTVDSSGSRPAVVLLTNDRDNLRKARTAGLHCLSIYDFVQAHTASHPALGPMLAAVMREDRERQQRQSWEYQPWLSAAEVQAGLLSGRLHKGTFKVNRDWHSEATVRVKAANQSLLIDGLQAMNRAIDGDAVVVEVLPEAEWKRAKGGMEPRMDEQDMVNIQANSSDTTADTAVDALPPASNSSPLVRTARVVAIAQRNWRAYAGSLSLSSKHRGSFMFLPVNRRIPRIRIHSQQAEQLMSKRLLVTIDSWPADSHNPLGHYVSTIGDIGDRETETAVLLLEHDIPTQPWTNAVLDCLPRDTHNIDARHTAGRVDYRGVVEVFSIDPPGCTDIDDALHVRQLANGNYEVAVHIADVAHYVKPDTALDGEAAHRGTSVYLVDRRIDMLPSLLSTNLCSLKSGIDRLTFSCVWEMNDHADIVHTTYHRAVIRSVASFTYQQAQDRIDDISTAADADSITRACKTLNRLAKQLRAKRIAAGALMLASAEVRFLLDNETRQPTDVGMYVQKEANALVEEFMLLANISVAQRINSYYPSFSLLRRHPTPPADNFAPLIQAAAAVGFTIQVDTSKQLADSLDRCVIPAFPMFNKLIRILATRCMTQAIYFCSGEVERGSSGDFHHYGLAAPIYTHFTSPIRRYADIVVHRLLAASVDYEPLPDSVQSRERMAELADNINHRHRMAQLVSRASAELYTLIYFGDGDGGKRTTEAAGIETVGRVVEEEAIIVSVRATGLRVFVPRYGLEAAITLVKKKRVAGDEEEAEAGEDGDSSGRLARSEYVFDAERLTVSGPRGTFRIFERVRVILCVREKQRRRWLNVQLVEKEGEGVVSQAVEAVEAFKQGGVAGGGGKAVDAMEDEQKESGEDVMVVEDEVEGDGEVVQDPSSVKRRRVIRSA